MFTAWSGVFVDDTSTITAAFLNQVRLQIPDAIDGAGGGEYSPTAPIVLSGDHGLNFDDCNVTGTMLPSVQLNIGGEGLRVTGPSRLDVLTNLTTDEDALVMFATGTGVTFDAAEADFTNGSTLDILSGSILSVQGSSSSFEVGSAATATWLSGTTATWNSGSTALFSGTVNLSGTSMHVTTGKTLDVDSGGKIKIDSGGHFEIASANPTVSSGGKLTWLSGATLQLNSGATFDDNGSTASIDSAAWSWTDSTIEITGTTVATVHGNAKVHVNNGGKVEFSTSGEISGSPDLTGALSVKSTGSIAYNSGSTSIWGSGSTFQINNGVNATLDEDLDIGGSAAARLNFATTFGGGVTFNAVDVADGDTADIDANTTVVHINATITGPTSVNLLTAGAHKGDIKIIYTTGAVTTGYVLVQSNGSFVFNSDSGGNELHFGALFVFGGTSWRHALAVNTNNGKINDSA